MKTDPSEIVPQEEAVHAVRKTSEPSILLDRKSRDILAGWLQFRRQPASIPWMLYEAYVQGTAASIPFSHMGILIETYGNEILALLDWPITDLRPARERVPKTHYTRMTELRQDILDKWMPRPEKRRMWVRK